MNRAHILRRAAFLGFTSTSLIVGFGARAQDPERDLYVDDPRPLSEALLRLTEQYPTIVTYEDPRYVYSADIKDVTAQVRRNPSSSSSRTLVPQGGILQVSYNVDARTGHPVSYENTLTAVLQVANLSPSGGRFAVRREGDIFHIVPTQVRDGQGQWVMQGSILETPISLATEELSYYQLTEAILAEVSKANGVTVGLAVERFMPTFMRYKGRVEATNEPARDVLMKTLHALSKRFTYHLLYDPSGTYYVFGAHLAAEPPTEGVPLQIPAVPRPGDPTPGGPPFRAER